MAYNYNAIMNYVLIIIIIYYRCALSISVQVSGRLPPPLLTAIGTGSPSPGNYPQYLVRNAIFAVTCVTVTLHRVSLLATLHTQRHVYLCSFDLFIIVDCIVIRNYKL